MRHLSGIEVAKGFAAAPGLRLEYFELVDGNTLQKIADWEDTSYAVGCITADFRCSVIMNACVPMAVSADGSNTSSTPEHAKALSGIRVIWIWAFER